jgi:hypothetical protein
MSFGRLDLEIYHDQHGLLRKTAHHIDEKNHPNCLFIIPNALIVTIYINEIVGRTYKIIAIIQRSESSKIIMTIQQGIKGAQFNH